MWIRKIRCLRTNIVTGLAGLMMEADGENNFPVGSVVHVNREYSV